MSKVKKIRNVLYFENISYMYAILVWDMGCIFYFGTDVFAGICFCDIKQNFLSAYMTSPTPTKQ